MKKAIYLSILFLNFISLSGQSQNTFPSSGSVGVGTTSPVVKLHLSQGTFFVDNTTTNQITLQNAGSHYGSIFTPGASKWSLGYSSNRETLGASVLTWTDGGNVGIGTSTPGGLLDVVDGSSRMVFTGNAGKGDIFRLFGANGMNFAVNFHTPNSGDLISDLGINYSLDGSNGTSAYARIGTKKAPMIRLNAENGSIALYGENGSGSDYRTPAFNLGLYVNNSGNVGIGTTNPQAKLAVNGDIFSKKVKVTQTGWPDYVFDSIYRLRSLSQLEQYIQENKHLPDVPSASEVEKNGLDLGDNQAVLLKKIEEITLYVIELKKENEEMKEKINKLENKKR